MHHVSVTREINAPASAVWAVLADFPNIADWNGGVKVSYSTGDAAEGVGATRHCDLSPTGSLEEMIREWEPEKKMVVSIDSASMLPIRKGLATFTLGDTGDAATTGMQLDYDFETKWGFVGKLMGGSMTKQLTKGFTGFLEDLEAAATSTG